MRRGAAHLLQKGLVAAVEQWHEHARLMLVMKRVLATLLAGGLRRSVRTWAVYAEERGDAMAAMETAVRRLR